MAQDAYGRGLGRAVGGGVQLGSSFRLGALDYVQSGSRSRAGPSRDIAGLADSAGLVGLPDVSRRCCFMSYS